MECSEQDVDCGIFGTGADCGIFGKGGLCFLYINEVDCRIFETTDCGIFGTGGGLWNL